MIQLITLTIWILSKFICKYIVSDQDVEVSAKCVLKMFNTKKKLEI